MSLLEKFVTQWITEADVDFLTQLCGEYNIVIPDAKVGKHQELLKLLFRHLNSAELEESDDQGAAVFLKLFNDLGTALGKGDPKREMADSEDGEADTSISYVPKLREFKISGTIDGGKAGTLSYSSLSCQLKQAEVAGYKITDIIAAVIKAIPTGSSFRTLLEAKIDLGQDDFFKLLRSHFKEKDSSRVLQELLNLYQLPGQDAHEFCCMAMALRDRIQALSVEEGTPSHLGSLTARMYHTIFTSLKQNSVRMVLHKDLKEGNLDDVDFLEKVALAEANETERLEKVKTKTEVNSLLTDSAGSGSAKSNAKPSPASQKAKNVATAPADEKNAQFDSKLDILMVKVEQIATNSASLSERVLRLENKMAASEHENSRTFMRGDGNFQRHLHGNGTSGRKIFKCKACIENKVGYCSHCLRCGSEQHKVKDCTEN